MYQNKELSSMVRKTGSVILLLSLWYVSTIAASIHMRVLNTQQQPITSVEMGVPFLVQVSLENIDQAQEPSGFEKLDDCTVALCRKSQSSYYINGVATHRLQLSYLVTPPCVRKNLEIGPLSVTSKDGTKIVSNTVTVPVGDVQQADYSQKLPYYFMVTSDEKKVYVGQKVRLYLKFCYRQDVEDVSLDNVHVPQAYCGYTQTQWQDSTVRLDQQEYSCKQMYVEIYPQKKGTLVIPPVKATYVVKQDTLMCSGGFNMVYMSQSYALLSNPYSIDVVDMPKSDTHSDVQLVGNFAKATLELQQKTAKVGEGIVVALTVEGDGNLEIARAPELQFPKGLHSYEGNSSYDRVHETLQRKRFEWIVQADEGGTYVIAPQNIVYFDPKKHEYRKLKTESCSITVIGNARIEKQEQSSKAEPAEQNTPPDSSGVKQEETPEKITYAYQTYFTSRFMHNSRLSQWLEWIIVLLAILLSVMLSVKTLWPRLQRYFFVQALVCRWLFWKIIRKNDVQSLYQFLERMTAAYGFGLQSPEIKEYFKQLGLSEETFESWNNFVVMMLQFNFASHSVSSDSQVVFNLAKQWFPIILSCCKLSYQKARKKS